jgi:hypothetical protein
VTCQRDRDGSCRCPDSAPGGCSHGELLVEIEGKLESLTGARDSFTPRSHPTARSEGNRCTRHLRGTDWIADEAWTDRAARDALACLGWPEEGDGVWPPEHDEGGEGAAGSPG